MPPKLNGVDHVHVYVASWSEAEEWYGTVLGFKPMEAFKAWATDSGPLMLEDAGGTIHLAVFESGKPPASTIAFGASGEEFLAWKAHLESHSLAPRLSDHKLSWSLYFSDPFGNSHEITTYDYDLVAARLS